MSSHYRSPLNFSDENIAGAKSALKRLYTSYRGLPIDKGTLTGNISDFENRFNSALDDDFNTPIALSILFEIAKQININRKENLKQAKTLAQLLIKLGNCIGILEYDVEDYLKQGMELSELNINEKIRQRDAARDSKDFALSDQIRDELLALDIILEDSTNGTTWRKK
jgi:cysteinyl-tRNA synthetase